jgi:hypothetical protein
MSPKSKKEHLAIIVERYRKANREKKTKILDELCANLGFNRKYAIRRIRALIKPKNNSPRHSPGPRSRYNDPSLLNVLQQTWLAAHMPCSKRLKALLPFWLPTALAFLRISLNPFQLRLLASISPATIDRILKPFRLYHAGKAHSATKPGLLLKHHIPIQTCRWDESRPGFLEADTVAHCGDSLSGSFLYTLNLTDLATGWTEQRAVWGKGEIDILPQLKHIEASLPFPLLGFDCDNGSEFLNWHIVHHFQQRKQPVAFTRSRPYKKDDNAHIEQKNWTQVRQWLGYQRFDNPDLVPLLNDLYTSQWRLFHNFFLPSTKLLKKQRIGSKIVKKHDIPKTPYHRLLESKCISSQTKAQLKNLFQTLNPFTLRKTIDLKIAKIRQLARLPQL